MKKILLLCITITMTVGIINAQTSDYKWNIGLSEGINQYHGDLGNAVFNFNYAFYQFTGLSATRYLSNSFNLGIQGTYGNFGFYANDAQNFISNKYDGILLLTYKFNNGHVLKETAKIAPFLAVGQGFDLITKSYSHYTNQYTLEEIHKAIPNNHAFDFVLPVGFGVKYQITDKLAIQYQCLYYFTNTDARDGVVAGKNDKYCQQSIGISFSFDRVRDCDHDGVPDRLDKCPNTPLSVLVDEFGCPLDKDKDGIPDYLDKCPLIPGIAAFDGCPDSDGDGVQDSEDRCPHEKGPVALHGCPDRDGDGIADIDDQCPDIKGLLEFHGCPNPDTDGDGIPDSVDRCPNEKGPIALHGCPDRDGDGIPDIDDKCPDIPGLASNYGCPEVKKEVLKIFEKALTGIQFETGKDIIKKTSFPILDQVAKVMIDNPSYNLTISGHTDNQGDDARNLELSQKRAEAVQKYLTSKTVAQNRMTAKGYGSTMPIADNKTKIGQALNRRVEFKVVFKIVDLE